MTINIPLDPELTGLLQMFDKPAPDTARELIVLELYRQGKVSSESAVNEALHLVLRLGKIGSGNCTAGARTR